MAPKSAAHMIFLAFLSLLAVAAAASKVGSWQPIDNPNAVKGVVDAAKFAVEDYNKNQKKSLVFVSIVKGESRVVAGIEYQLIISARDGKVLGAPAENYDADVWFKAGEKGLHLISFQKTLTG